MSRTLKRPMFRKGGEVMEGIMTGIKPRKMYNKGSLNTADQGVIDNVRRKMNLIDVISGSGSSPLGDPLTQFLLTTGQNLISGESAGGTKLQELVGATRKPLAAAIKQQQLKDLSRRKLAATLIAKTGGSDVAKMERKAKRISEITNRPYKEVLTDVINQSLYADPKAPGTILQQEKTAYRKNLLAPDMYGRRRKPEEATAITDAYFKVRDKKGFNLDNTMFDIPKKELAKLEPTTAKVGGKNRKAFKPSGSVVFQDDTVYYDVRGQGKYLIFDAEQNVLIPLK